MHSRYRRKNIRAVTIITLTQILLVFLLFSLFMCCTLQHKADVAQSGNTNASSGTSTDSLAEQFGDNRLLQQLKSEQGIEKPFAWQSWGGRVNDKGGTVVGIDQNGMLKIVEFTRTQDGYIVKPAEYQHESNARIRESGDIELTKLLPDTEFPFRSFIVSAGDCNVHFILLWQARNRSLNTRSVFLDAIQLRIIVEKNGKIVSNKLEELLFLSLDKTLVEDVNKDGKRDFLVVGSNMITFVRIWTVGDDCAVKPLLFKEGDHFLESVRDKGLFVAKNKVSGVYDVHVTHYEPITKNRKVYYEVTETVYRWDSIELVYKISETHSRLEYSGEINRNHQKIVNNSEV